MGDLKESNNLAGNGVDEMTLTLKDTGFVDVDQIDGSQAPTLMMQPAESCITSLPEYIASQSIRQLSSAYIQYVYFL
jgi:hypothetical protein